MSTILLTHEYAPFRGGAATYVEEIAAAATRLGFEVEVWAPDRMQPTAPNEMFHVERLHCSGRLNATGVLGFTEALVRKRRQLAGRRVVLLSVGAHMAWAALHAAGLLATGGVTAFFHGSEVMKFDRSCIWKPLMRRLYERVDGYAAASDYVQKLVRQSSLTVAAKPLTNAPCAVPRGLVFAGSDLFPRAGFNLLTVARLHPRKGQLEMAGALGLLPPEVKAKVTYHMVGTGEEAYRATVEAASQEAGVACSFYGALEMDALSAAYRSCDLYVQSSRTMPRSVEGFGISYLEAAAFGKPSVGVRTGGVGEAVIDGVTGLLAPEGDLNGLTHRIERLLSDSVLRQQMGDAGRLHARRFNWEDSARKLLA